MPPPNCVSYLFTNFGSRAELVTKLKSVIADLDGVTLHHLEKSEGSPLIVEAERNTWSRAERRKRARVASHNVDERGEGDRAHGTRMVAQFMTSEEDNDGREFSQTLMGRWFKGDDRVLWESFWSHLIRKLSS